MSTLLTTLSILNNRNNIAYYSAVIKGKKYYSTGISQQEIGTKYFLSDPDVNIDRIIVIGSEETYSAEDQKKSSDLKADYETLKESFNRKDSSALEFYSYRIASFLNGKSDEEKTSDSDINDVRKGELQKIVSDYLKEHHVTDENAGFQKFQKLNNRKKGETSDSNNLYFADIRKLIQTDIEKNFVKTEDYKKYEKVESFPEFDAIRNDQQDLKEMTAGIEEIQRKLEKNKANRNIENEAYAVAADSSLEQARQTLEEQKIHGKEELYAEVLSRIRVTIRKLIEQIQSMKNNRLNQETNYAKYYLYDCLSSDYKLQAVTSEKTITLEFVPLKTNRNGKEEENLTGIVNAILTDGKEDLYIDMQGGSRTDGYVRNAVLSILNNEDSRKIEVRRIVATDFSPLNFVNPIVDETKRYQITDLVSGMNAFIQYGRADLIEKYVKEADIRDERTIQLVNQMVLIDHSLSVCNIDDLFRSINGLRDIFNQEDSQKENMIFEILEEGIRSDYRELLESKDGDYVSLARWALRKNFIQQAMTIIEAKMPEELISRGILYYAKNDEDIRNTQKIMNQLRSNNKNDHNLKDVNRFFIKYYFLCNHKEQTYQYIPNYTGHYSSLEKKKVSQDAAIRYLYENDGKCRGCFHVYTKMDSINEAIRIRKQYLRFASARNELNHASVDMNRLCDCLGVKYCPGSNETAYEIVSKSLGKFLRSYEKIVEKYPIGSTDIYMIGKTKPLNNAKESQNKKKQNCSSNPQNSKNQKNAIKSDPVKKEPEKPRGTILQTFPYKGRGVISSKLEKDGMISFYKKDMDPDVFDQLSRGDKVEYERFMPADSVTKEMLAVHVKKIGN